LFYEPEVLSIRSAPRVYIVQPASASEVTDRERKELMVNNLANQHDFDHKIIFNVINSETGNTWNCDLVGKAGELGCLQIIPKYHKDVDPLDFEASVKYFISEYKAGRGSAWTGCSCTKSARLSVPNLPSGDAKDLPINSNLQEGKIAILNYNGTIHAVAYEIRSGGILAVLEGNFKPCVIKNRLIPWEEVSKHIVGFYAPEGTKGALIRN
jgi:hypothetical protein